MKLEPRPFRILWDVHAWGGVAAALVLNVMFFCGAFALFFPEIDLWSEPARPAAAGAKPVRLDPLLEQLTAEENLRRARRLSFSVHGSGVTAYLDREEGAKQFRYDPASRRFEASGSSVGSFLYDLHYLSVVPNGIYVAGLLAMALLLAIVSGVLIHVHNLVRQFFQFRPEHALRTWTSDLHKVLGVFGLPFQLFYAWSGAVLCLAPVLVEPALVLSVFGGDHKAADAVHGFPSERPGPTGTESAVVPRLDAFVDRARSMYPGFSPSWVGIEHAGDRGAHVALYGQVAGVPFGNAEMAFRVDDGALLDARGPGDATVAQRFDAWFFGLHYARFGGYGVRFLYAFLALCTCAVIVTGNLVWLERRDARRASAGNRLLERLTVGSAAGLAVATGALFSANRALPASLAGRQGIEQGTFWGVWLVAILLALAARSPRNSAAVLLLAAAVLFAIPAGVDRLSRAPAFDSALHRGVDAGLVLLAAASAVAGATLLRKRATSPPASTLQD